MGTLFEAICWINLGNKSNEEKKKHIVQGQVDRFANIFVSLMLQGGFGSVDGYSFVL